MATYDYIIIGGGMTGAAAVRGIRKVDTKGSIGLFGTEPDRPYKRPPLSKGLWKGEPLDSIWDEVPRDGLDLHLNCSIVALNPENKQITDDQKAVHTYGSLLLATGCTPRRFAFGGDRVIYYRTLNDYRTLRELTDRYQQFAVIGGGFIGAEVAAALAMNGKRATLIFPGDAIGGRLFPADLGGFLNTYYRDKGVDVLPGGRVTGIEPQGSQQVVTVQLKTDGQTRNITVDGVVAGIGVVPNVDLAQQANVAVDNGIIVDDHLRTNQPAIFAAGDVAFYPQPQLNERRRVEHEDNANVMGRRAGQIMAGATSTYTHLPFFYSDLFDLGYEAVGDVDSRLETVEDWQDPFRTGVVYYLKDQRVRGVLLWNVWDQVKAARALIAEPGPFNAANLKGRLPA